MPLNFGYAGVGKEATYGTGVAPTAFFRIQEPAVVQAQQNFAEILSVSDFGPSSVVATTRSASGEMSAVATPGAIGHLFAALLGAPSTSGTGPYVHTFTPGATVPSYTVEVQDGTGAKRLLGGKVSELSLSHAVDGVLTVKANWMGADKVTASPAATPTVETAFFTQQMVSILVNAVEVRARAESLETSLSLPKEVHAAFGTQAGVACEPTGEGDVTAQVTLRFDSAQDAGRFADYVNGNTLPIVLKWTRDANTELQVSFTAYLTADPLSPQNRDLKTARVQLSLRAVRAGGALVTVTLKNATSAY